MIKKYYNVDWLIGKKVIENGLAIAYARASSLDQALDLKRQTETLIIYCTKQGWIFKIIEDKVLIERRKGKDV